MPEAVLEAVRARLRAGKTVRRNFPGGRLHIDRPLPFLVVYRRPRDRADPGTAELVRAQPSYLIASADAPVAPLCAAVVEELVSACGACLLLEIWSAPEADAIPSARIYTPASDRLATTIEVLAEAVRAIALPVGGLACEVAIGAPTSPGEDALVAPSDAKHGGCLLIGLELPPVYRSPKGVYPFVVRQLARELDRALQQTFFEFTRVQTAARPEHFQVMGRRRLLRSVREADRALVAIARSFDFLLDVTPVNGEEAWAELCRDPDRSPELRYRMLGVDPELVKRQLYDLPLEHLEDPVLAMLLRDKRRELDRQLGLLEDRDTPRFLPGSLQLYGAVDDALLCEAEKILAELPYPSHGSDGEIDSSALAARARAELDHYRRDHPSLASAVQLRDDLPSLMVSHGDLLVPRALRFRSARVEALLQHEIGTHVVTHANGDAQPLGVLAAGLAGCEALQEGLAMFAEHVSGGLDRSRLRLVAARVVAVHRLETGTTLAALVSELHDRHGIPLRSAFDVALRVFRGGGLAKDAIYLRGLLQLLGYLAEGGSLEPLLVGKIALEQVPLIEELLRRGLLRPALLRPRWLDAPAARTTLARARRGLRPLDLVESEHP
jgi:uncharacterized protein (TIGR02421 family)